MLTLKEAAHSLYERLTKPAYPDWLSAIGVRDTPADPCIVVYLVRKEPGVSIPEQWEGHRVVVRVDGGMVLM